MSQDPVEPREGDPVDAATLLARAAIGEPRADAWRAAAMRDLLLPDEARLDDRHRAAIHALLRTILGTIGGELHGFAARSLHERGEPEAVSAIEAVEAADIFGVVQAALLREADVATELYDRTMMDLLAERLPGGEGAGALARFVDDRDRVVAQRASALMIAENRRRAPIDRPPYATDLSAEVHVRFVWTVAAAIGSAAQPTAGTRLAIERALADAALRSLAAHDEGERLEAASIRLAAAVDARGETLGALLEAVLADRRAALFAALLAHALRIGFDEARAILVRPGDTRLWLALRALDLSRSAIARIGYMLSEADPRRDIEAFADLLDPLMAIGPAVAAASLAPLRLPRAYRDAAALVVAEGGR